MSSEETVTLINGIPEKGKEVMISAPNKVGTVNVGYLSSSWLDFDWNNDTSIENSQELASFGQYRGSDRIVFWGEKN